ncbi:RRM domain-containing protein [Caenorhabditis elegans]|uniref:RRM domain-containing protein n=1 Tax=Caenorhabditis elegans TaxID=6239 RepID=A0A2K5ATT0_CAEEL|nr:RRM domain-containing protein [Caenorhabditis elegans]SPC47524.1 RRM domain-containing protein [Caenorhabditis elegans]|eukprot:NP_001348729.1 RNA Binding Motif protein homolog [Caenorhabditis elegans]
MHIDNEDALFDWLSDELSPITDADPNALAKYVLALVKKPDKGHDELKAFTNEQLNVFLTDHTAPFVDKVFEALTSKSYMPASTAPTSASATAPDLKKEKAPAEKPSKPTAPPGVQKSSSSPSASKAESRPLRKRISPPPSENREKEKQSRDKERRRSRSPRDRRGRATTSRSGRTSSSDRDRHSKRRSRSRSRLPPPGYNPLNPPPPGVVVAAGEYNPEAPALNNYSIPPPPIPGQWQQPHVAAQYVPQSVSSYSQPPPAAAQGVVTQPGSFRGAPRGRGNIRGRGGFARGGFTGAINRDNCTLQVAKIPPEMNTIAKLNEHFATFGTVDNIQVRYNGEIDSALVTYASKFDAGKAYKSPTPVLNNRFIKVFWHNPGGEGSENATGKPSSPTSPPKPVEKPKIATVQESKFVSVAAQNYRKQIQDAKERLTKEKSILSTLVQAQNQHNIILDKWMVKQKELLIKARTSTDETDKKNATKLVKHLHKKIKACKEEVDGILLKISEKSMVVDEIAAQIEELKNPQKSDDSTRKRKAGSDGDEPQSKMSSVVIVRGVTDELVTDLMAHMEKFGEVFDHSVKADDDGLITAVFPFRKTGDALKAMADGKVLNGVDLEMELKTERIEEIPSTDTNMSADQLLAAIPSNLESDEEDDLLND